MSRSGSSRGGDDPSSEKVRKLQMEKAAALEKQEMLRRELKMAEELACQKEKELNEEVELKFDTSYMEGKGTPFVTRLFAEPRLQNIGAWGGPRHYEDPYLMLQDHIPRGPHPKQTMQKNLHFSGQLERTKIPSFDGEKSKFESFWAAFINIVDIANVSPEMKMLRLKEKLVGKAGKVVESLGYSAEEYETAKKKLERKFGGERRKLETYIDKLKHIKILRVGNSDELDEFADNLVDAVVKLRASGRHRDLDPNSTLYRDLLAKMPTAYLSRFHEWKKREYRDPNLESLKEWVVEQAELLVQAMEDKAGLDLAEKRDVKKYPLFPGKKKEWNNGGISKDSVFVTNESGNEKLKNKCRVCGEDHDTSRCEELKKRSVGDRWKTAKACGLCYRCLEANHRGNDCGSSKICRIDGCKKTHHYLLHSKHKANKSKAETKQE